MKRNNEDLGVYLKDHYAGGVGALELLEHLSTSHDDETLKEFFLGLQADINSDHKTLHEVMTRLGFEESSVRNAGAWVAEKFGRTKLGFGSEKNHLQDLQALELLFMGITGKRLLWLALAKVRSVYPSLQDFDFANLEQRALQQLDRVETKRLEIAQITFGM